MCDIWASGVPWFRRGADWPEEHAAEVTHRLNKRDRYINAKAKSNVIAFRPRTSAGAFAMAA